MSEPWVNRAAAAPWPGTPDAYRRELVYVERLDAVVAAHRTYTATPGIPDGAPTVIQLDRAQTSRRRAHDLVLAWRAARGHAIENEVHEAIHLALLFGEQDAVSHETMWTDVVGFLQVMIRDEARS